jgi:predicted acylesterase/phospholipase RssA
LLPLFEAKGLTKNTTFKQLYEFNNIDIHVFSTNLNGDRMKSVDISYKTHPNMSVIRGISMTTAYPFIFCPVIEEGNCYVDGGILNNFPVTDCFKNYNCDEKEILAFNSRITNSSVLSNLNDESTLFDYFIVLFKKMNREIYTENMEITNLVDCNIDKIRGFQCWVDTLELSEMREELINDGIEKANLYIERKTENRDTNVKMEIIEKN